MRQAFTSALRDSLARAMAQAAERQAQTAAVPYFPEYAGRPLDLIREVLGVELQDEDGNPNGKVGHHEASRYVIEALWKHRYVHERGPRKFSKTFKNADLVLAFFLEAPSIVLLLGPTYTQVVDQQMGGIKERLRAANEWRGSKGLPLIEPHITERKISFGERHYIKAISADKPGAVQGYHAGLAKMPTDFDRDPTLGELAEIEEAVRDGQLSGHRILVVEDEAPDVRRPLYDALEGTLQGPLAFNLMTGNPTLDAESDHPYAQAGKMGSRYHTVALSHLSTELYPDPYEVDKRFDRGYGTQEHADAGMIPQSRVGKYGLNGWIADRDWIENKERTWGAGSGKEALLKAYVLGQYASVSDEKKVVPLDLLLATQDNVPEVQTGIHIGVDLAGSGGDRCVAILLVHGYPRAFDVWSHEKGDVDKTGKSAKRILALMAQWGKSLSELDGWDGSGIPAEHVHIDDTGMVGVCDWLRGKGHAVDAVDFAAAGDSRTEWSELLKEYGRFLNLRARMHFMVAALLEARLLAIPDLPEWAELRQEMQWPSWEFADKQGETKLKVRPKVDIKAEYGRSPDWFDALMLACCRKPKSKPTFGAL